MLIWMRESTFGGIFKYILLGFMTLAVAGLVLMDVGGFFTGSMSSGTIVKGGGVNISAVEFDRTLRRVLSAQGMGAEEAYKLGLTENVLSSEIQNRLFTVEAQNLGLKVDDESIKRQIARLAEPLATEGRSKKEALQQILRTQGISEGEFVGSLRQELANGLFRNALQAPPTLTSPIMAKTLYRYDNEKRSADAIVLKNSTVAGITAPTEEQLQKYYEGNKQDFLIPETRTITMATLKTDMLKKNIQITDEQLKAEYDKNIASFTKPVQRAVDQAVFNTEDEAKKAFEAWKTGTAPKDVVSQDYEQTGLLPEIGTPVFEAKKGAIVGPIKTELGWHVLKVKDILGESVTPLAQVKDKLKTELENIALTQELYNAGNTIEDRAAGGDNFDDIVKEYGMTTEVLGPFRRNGFDKDGKDVFKPYGSDKESLLQSAYDFDAGEIAPVVETADGQFHLVHVDKVTPDSYRDFASVKADLEKRWKSEQQRLANRARAQKALEALKSGKSLADVAKEESGSVQTFTSVSRKSTPPSPLTPVVAAQIFSTDKGKPFSGEIEDGYVVGTVKNITLPQDANASGEELKALEELTGTSLSQDMLRQFVTNLTKNKKVKINQAALETMYGGQSQNTQTQ